MTAAKLPSRVAASAPMSTPWGGIFAPFLLLRENIESKAPRKGHKNGGWKIARNDSIAKNALVLTKFLTFFRKLLLSSRITFLFDVDFILLEMNGFLVFFFFL